MIFYSYNGILYSNGNEQTNTIHENMDASHKYGAERNETQRVHIV